MKALTFVVMLLLACAESNSATVVEVPPPQQQDLPPPVVTGTIAQPLAPPASSPLVGDWRGSYECAQGTTALELHVTRVSPDVEAIFVFNHAGSGASGSYSMFGNVDPQGAASLEPNEWINRPPSYIMVGMRGFVRGDVFSGKMQHQSCGNFELHRVR